jgi:hypothetical protein
MNPLKGTGAKKGSITLFIGSTLLVVVVGFMGMVSMPQMIVSVNAQSERASERACPVPGFTLSRGECTAEPITKLTCEPSSVAGETARVLPDSELCRATTTFESTGPFVNACTNIVGSHNRPIPTGFECTFPATETITCPGDITPTEEGECITKPGRGNDDPT